MKQLVAYFSASGITKAVAEKLARIKEADLFEIIPQEMYTSDDLDWTNANSRSSIEMKDKSSRPKIISKVKNINEYDVIYLGFPIWWYQAPTIINTFLEMYDFNGQTIIPFATSGGSGMGKTNQYLLPSFKKAKLLDGKRLSSNPSEEELKHL